MVREKDLFENHFLNEDSLQLRVVVENDGKLEPLVYKRERLCQEAEKKAQQKLYEDYPKAKKIMPNMEILYKLYTEQGGCMLIVRFSAPGLKKELE
ncbi:MAG: hypothetical protein NZM25_07105 [Leptospiraceae bacterium]|nr:hypothetical protein [Leptospiraceae bacterium]MDW8307087.1 hypothetical protein [Leptospiraceae bacterium]